MTATTKPESLASLRRRKAALKAELKALIKANGGPITSKDRGNFFLREIAKLLDVAR